MSRDEAVRAGKAQERRKGKKVKQIIYFSNLHMRFIAAEREQCVCE